MGVNFNCCRAEVTILISNEMKKYAFIFLCLNIYKWCFFQNLPGIKNFFTNIKTITEICISWTSCLFGCLSRQFISSHLKTQFLLIYKFNIQQQMAAPNDNILKHKLKVLRSIIKCCHLYRIWVNNLTLNRSIWNNFFCNFLHKFSK